VRVLVTGGTGFIGSHLCERLLRDGVHLSIIDDLNDFYSPQMKLENLRAIQSVGPAAFFECDICSESEVMRIIKDQMPDIVVHLAARAGVRHSLEQPLLYEHTNVHGTMVLLESCRQVGVRQFVFASSSSVYGATGRVPFRETNRVDTPVSVYAATKLAGEQVCYAYSHLYGIRTICLRFFTVYGPRQRPDLAIRKFSEFIAQGKAIPVFGNGTSSRDYTFVDDIVDGIVGAFLYECDYDILNLGNSQPIQLLKMIKTIEQALGRTATLEFHAAPPGDLPTTCADISKARRFLGYSPRTPFDEGVRKFVHWLKTADLATRSVEHGAILLK
jgi:UDP-glucuronate 4-epimerase